MNLTTWDSIKSKRRNPSISSGHIILEFDRTKKQKIFAHTLGKITFETRDLNSPRNEVIEIQKENLNLNGFVYKNIGHTYSDEEVIIEDQDLGGFPIYSHGHPLGGTEYGGMESCSREGMICKNGEGTDDFCNPGKCIIGKLSYVRNKKWKYESYNTYSTNESPNTANLPLVYFLNGIKEVRLHSILRGKVLSFSNESKITLNINSPASKYSRILLPPKYYFSEDFIDTAIRVIDERLNNVDNPPKTNLVGLENRKDRFISSFITLTYPNTSDGFISSILHENDVREEIKTKLLSTFSTLPDKWYKQCSIIIENEYLYKESRVHTNLSFIVAVYNRIKSLFDNIVQITESSLKRSILDYKKTSISRPIYSRLPGISEAYRSDSLFSESESPAQWLTSGADDFLSKKKDQISTFYQDYLDPETCSPLILDWLAQHVGLTGDLWNELWDDKIKRAFIKNSFGWWDRQNSVEIPAIGKVLTAKGRALEKFPFTQSEWSLSPESNMWGENPLSWDTFLSWSGSADNLLSIKLDEIETINVENGNTIASDRIFKIKTYSETTDKVSIVSTDKVRIDKLLWNGLMEAKGSLLGIAFLSSMFGLKAHTPTELEIVDLERGIFKPRTGLRNSEILAPILLPYKQDVIQVGTTGDANIKNYINQLVADVSRVGNVQESNNVFFRVPYYYNRNGKSWDRVSYIARNWAPSNLNIRIQYPYLSADLWAIGDAFFEPKVIETTVIIPPTPPVPPTPGNSIFDLVPTGYYMIESETADNEFITSEQGDILLL